MQVISVPRQLGTLIIVHLLGCFDTFSYSKSFFWYAIDTNLFPLESTNPKKNCQTLDAYQMFEWIIVLLFTSKLSTCLYPNYPGTKTSRRQFGYKEVDDSVPPKIIITNSSSDIWKSSRVRNFFQDCWTQVGTGWYQWHTR